ncbi:serine/threonine-protein kinase [Planomonospora sp. ID67723]|uniref:serine/threonine protein kinase n=1 Tax=Planomonospora sp. ID67723 TaxID=2738134 RepID=UPI001E463728|nr:serine/threonine-protein kinase [Planomonospora sp. ID67723]
MGPFELTGRLGEGGQGVVYLGRGPAGEQVAVKLLHHGLAADAEARARFLREVSVAQRVARFCTASVLHADLAGSRPYIVSEYVPGPSLRQLVDREGPRRGAALDRLAVSTATALAAIHRAGILHRDFKPANVLMGPEGPVVIDFGIARALDSPGTTATGTAMGTPSYLAPEQLSGGAVTPAADVFAWGVTMVFAATGTPAFGQDSIAVVMNRILTVEPDLTGMEGQLRGLVAACLDKDPAARPTAEQLVAHLMSGTVPAAPAAAVPPAAAGTPPQPNPAGPGAVPRDPRVRTTSPSGPARPGPRPGPHPEPEHRPRRPKGLLLAGVAGAVVLGVATGTVVVVQNGQKASSVRTAQQAAPSLSGQEQTAKADPEPTPDGPAPAPEEEPSTSEPQERVPGEGEILTPEEENSSPATEAPSPLETEPAAKQSRRPTKQATSEPEPEGGMLGPDDGAPVDIGQSPSATTPTTKPTVKPTPKPTPKPTVKPTTKPTVKPTPKPTVKPTTSPPKPNPYTAAGVCGPGFKQINSHALGTGATVYLLYDGTSKKNCVVTLSRYVIPGKIKMNATLQVQGGASAANPGSFTAYAGPVRLAADKKCVIWGGAYGTATWKSGWSHCG